MDLSKGAFTYKFTKIVFGRNYDWHILQNSNCYLSLKINRINNSSQIYPQHSKQLVKKDKKAYNINIHVIEGYNGRVRQSDFLGLYLTSVRCPWSLQTKQSHQ